jgi:hypothetical protein
MSDDLNRFVWTAYRQAGGDDRRATRATASSAFQLAVDVVLRHRPGVDARSRASPYKEVLIRYLVRNLIVISGTCLLKWGQFLTVSAPKIGLPHAEMA